MKNYGFLIPLHFTVPNIPWSPIAHKHACPHQFLVMQHRIIATSAQTTNHSFSSPFQILPVIYVPVPREQLQIHPTYPNSGAVAAT